MTPARACLTAIFFVAFVAGCSGGSPGSVDSGSGGVDVGTVVDVGATNDTGTDAFTALDAPATDTGVSCDPSRVRFPGGGGSLSEGQLCDDVFACVPTGGDAAALMAAAPDFDCSGPTEGGCSGVSCVLRPSTLDAHEVQQICAVTVLPAVTDVTCMIYL